MPGRRLQHPAHAALWIALAAALSASLHDLAMHVVANPWARSAAVFPFLLAYCAWTGAEPRRPARGGLALLVAGVALAMLGVGGGMPRIGRPGIALAVIGLARMTGSPSARTALLALWMIPFPTQVIDALAPGLAGAVAHVAVQLGTALGVDVHVDARRVVALWLVGPVGHLELFPGDGGLSLAWSFLGLGWFVAVQRDAPLAAAMRTSLCWMLAAIPVQVAGLAIACAAALGGAPQAGRALLDHLPLGATLLALGWALHARGRAPHRAPRADGAAPVASLGA